jgi:hypothetical protein
MLANKTKTELLAEAHSAGIKGSSFMSFGADQGFAAADTCARPLSLLLLLGLSGDRRAR